MVEGERVTGLAAAQRRINDAGSLEATEHGSIRRDYES